MRRLLVADQERIVDAIKDGNRTEAKKRMREHILNTRKKALEALLRDRLKSAAEDAIT